MSLAYYVIPVILIYFVRKRRDLPFQWTFVLFGVFIFGCGTTHLMEVWTLWHGTYRLTGVIKAITAAASLAAAAALIPIVPAALAIPGPAAWRLEIAERKRAEQALDQAREELEMRVEERTVEMRKANADLVAEILQRTRAEDERRKLASLVENSTDFIGIASLDGRALFINAAGRSMVGLEDDVDVRNMSILDYAAEREQERVTTEILRVLSREGRWEGEILFRNFHTETFIPMWQHVFFITDEERGVPLAIGTISRDITERKRSEEKLHSAQAQLAHMARLTTLGELIASIAHEVNQPLSALVTNADAAVRWFATKPPNLIKTRACLREISREGNRASEIIRNIRGLVKRAAPQKEAININELIVEVIGLAAFQFAQNHVLLQTDLEPNLPVVFADRVQLQQVLLNLIINGIEAMSSVTDRPKELLISSKKTTDDPVLLTVSDSGKGFGGHLPDRLFEAFFTTKSDGIGLGLSISRSIVEAHGGRLWASANSAGGAAFHFTLPASKGAAA
jgi:PAS domain S-box-containing protein